MEKVIRKSSVYLTCPAKPGRDLAFLDKNMAKFTREFNEKTKDKVGERLKVEIKVFQSGKYEFKIKNTPLVHRILSQILNRPSNYRQLKKEEREKIRREERKEISQSELQELTQQMLPFLNTTDLTKAQKVITGTIGSLGMKVKD
jgi:large subunit ribosomal protein L11